MKICMIVEDYPPGGGGGGIAVYEISRRLAKKHQVTVVTISRKDKPTQYAEEGVDVVRLGSNRMSFFFLALKYLFSKEAFDIYHAHGTFCGLIAKLVSAVKKKPVILHLHGYRDKSFSATKYYLQNFIIRLGFDRIISADRYGAEQVKKLGIKKEKIAQISGGVDLERFKPQQPKTLGKTVFLFVGRLTKIKNVDMLIRAISTIPKKNVELLVVGDGEMKDELITIASAFNLDNVKFLGSVPHERLPQLYSQASFLVLPSSTEGQPLVVLEALASGTPIIVSDIPPLKDLAGSSGAGYTFKVNDQAALVAALKNMLEIKPIAYLQLCKQARKYAEENFDWGRAVEKIRQTYGEIAHV